ncbi:hypothetical protein ScPMuIL_013814 [Solemya velum]
MVRLAVETSKRLPRHLRNEDIPTQTFTPRTYQVELLDAALQHNTIVCLSSASGKTFIAVMFIRELAHQVRTAFENGGRRSIFLVNSESMLGQQSQILNHHTNLEVGHYNKDCVSQWSAKEWKDQIFKCNVLIMPAEVFYDILSKKFILMSQINALIFDECHFVTKEDHPYSRIMHIFNSSSNQLVKPRILGLTSNILIGHSLHPGDLEKSVNSLEQKLHSTAETSTLVISERYGIRPKEVIVNCEGYEDETGLCSELGTVLETAIHFLQDCNLTVNSDLGDKDPRHVPKMALSECLNILYKLGPWCSACIAQMLITQLEKMDKHESNTMHKKFLKYGATQLRIVIRIFDKKFKPDYEVDELLMYCSPKVRELFKILRKYKPDYDFMIISEELEGMMSDSDISDDSDFSESENEDVDARSKSPKQIHVAVKRKCTELEKKRVSDPLSLEEEKFLCGIIFVEYQYVAFALNKFIEEVCAWDEQLCFVKSHHITGQGLRSSDSKKNSRTYKRQEDILRKFRMQELNLLVSTNVLEEGVDVPKCNLIIRFDLPKDYRSYSHSKGRARAREAQYLLLVEPEQVERFEADLAVYKGIEQVLVGRLKDKDDSDSSDSGCEDLVPPYVTSEEEGLKVTMETAISIVNRYCAKLPSDAFTHLTPKCVVDTVNSKQSQFIATVQLPINSPIREEVTGVVMPSKSLAKKSAALKMCELLHKSGELDDQLMPVGKEFFMYEEEDKDNEDEDMLGEARPGTTKRKQYYFKKVANALLESHPKSPSMNQLYLIDLRLTGPITEDQNTRGRRIYAPEETTRSFGLITSKSIPSGEVTVSLSLLSQSVEINDEDFSKLQQFHTFLFSNVLRLEKDPMEYNAESALVGCLIVPLNGSALTDLQIDWNFVNYVETNKMGHRKNIFGVKKDNYEFHRDVLEDAVVMPSYRNIDQPQHFYVAEIRTDLTPLSPFPSPELYKTFSDYYTSKYGLVITSKTQPLLDVDHTSARLNLLTPRYMNQKGVALPTSSAETKKARRENLQQKQILIPELCDVHVFPASLWRKAVCLPTVLYRVNYLLLAEEIRIKIAIETKIGIVELPAGFCFPKFDFGFDTSPEKLASELVDVASQKDDINCDGEASSDTDGDENTNVFHDCEDQDKTGEDSDGFKSCEEFPENINGEKCSDLDSDALATIANDQCENTFTAEDMNVVSISKVGENEREQHSDREHSSKKEINVEHSKLEFKTTSSIELETQESGKELDGLVSKLLNGHIHQENETFLDQKITNTNNKSNNSCQKSEDLILRNGFIKNKGMHDITQEFPEEGNTEQNSNNKEEMHSSTMLNAADNCTVQVADNVKFLKQRDLISGTKTSEELCGELFDLQDGLPNNSCNRANKDDMFSEMDHFMKEVSQNNASDSAVNENDMFPEPLHSMDDVDLTTYVGPSPCTILQALTMSNANDFFSLERLETIGDSFLKYAITVYLYCTYPGIHEGKLSYLRSKQVSNYNLYHLGKKKNLAECMISTKFEPYENWLPPGYIINESKRKGPVPKVLIANSVISKNGSSPSGGDYTGSTSGRNVKIACPNNTQQRKFIEELEEVDQIHEDPGKDQGDASLSLNPYSLQTQHSIPDKSIADCVEALIGCYLTSCGKKAALLFMSWLGLKVLPRKETVISEETPNGIPKINENEFDKLPSPPSPLLNFAHDAERILNHLLDGYDAFEQKIGYTFQDRSFLLQAFTHASYHYNTVTDCYQR